MSKEKKINILVIFLILSVAFAIKLYNDKKSNELLNGETSITFGYYAGNTIYYAGGPESYFNYYLKGEKYRLSISKKIDFLTIGDTILVRYSVTQPSVAEVEDLYFMEKYKHKRSSKN